MEIEKILYIIGLVIASFYILTGFDDFIWDIVTLIKACKYKNVDLDIKELDSVPPKLIAVLIAAWHEENVLERVIDNIIVSQIYPKTMYHIFLGLYPNDIETVEVAKMLEKKYPNIHCVINYKDGPTTKAQNLNYVIKQIKEFEKDNNYRFALFTVHDSEDVVHPYELRVTNYLIDKYPALQFPVFPLIKKPKLSKFFKNITTNTYADEFAENHFIAMVNRHRSGAFVPSAGTGFSLSRETIESLGDSVLPEDNLTEDYKLSLTLYKHGLQMYYVMERIKRVNWEGEIKWDYIATRSIFPNTFKAAVKQKTRWILGITMQSFQAKNLFNKDMPLIGRYSLYKDQKAKFINLFSGIGYPILIYFIISLFVPMTPIYPIYSFSWFLILFVTLMMLNRQLLRAISLYNVYGFKSVFYGVLFPPLVPIRIVWGNIINFTATVRAHIQYLKKDIKENQLKVQEDKEEKIFAWAKTEHDFLDADVLVRYQRKLGDILIEKGYIEPELLKDILKVQPDESRLGTYLMEKNIINENQVVECLSVLSNEPYLFEESLKFYRISELSKECANFSWEQDSAIPLYRNNEVTVFAYCKKSPLNLREKLMTICDTDVHLILASCETIKKGLMIIENQLEHKTTTNIIEKEHSIEQVLLIRNYASLLNKDEEDVLRMMGLSAVYSSLNRNRDRK